MANLATTPNLPRAPFRPNMLALVNYEVILNTAITNEFTTIRRVLNGILQHPILPSFTVATVPAAASYLGGLIFVSNEAGGATVAFSDGTNWRRVQDRVIIS